MPFYRLFNLRLEGTSLLVPVRTLSKLGEAVYN